MGAKRSDDPGAANERPGLVLLPGLLNDSDLWAQQIADLDHLADIRVPDTSSHHAIPELARAILAEAPARFSLAGLSMGGYVAFEILRQAPERVTRLALVNTSARPDTEAATSRRRGLIELAQKGEFKGVTPQLLPSLLSQRHLANEALTNRVYDMAARVGREGFIRQQHAIMGRPDSRPLLPQIAVPTLVIGGREDTLTPPGIAEEMAAAIPGADLLVLSGAGHLSPMERPHAVSHALRDWLERTWTPDQPSEIGAAP